MKKLAALFILVLFLSACGTETEEVEVTANETFSSEEEKSGAATDLPEVEAEEPVPAAEAEVEEVAEEPEAEVEEPAEEPAETLTAPETETLTAEEIEMLVSDYIGVDDKVTSFEVADGKIRLAMTLAVNDLFNPEDLAITRYTQLSDELLLYEGWDTLIVEYEGIGTIDMDITETESNEYGSYFPRMAVEEELKY